MPKQAYISGVGHYVPERVITNQDLTQWMDTSDEWIRERTGIEERRFAVPGQDTVANMGVRAAQMALRRAQCTAADVDFVVFATITPDYYFPGSGMLFQREMGLPHHAPALDIRMQCSGFVYALSIAEQYIRTDTYRRILVVGSELQSTALNLSTEGRNMAVIFGDGAGAAVVEAAPADGERGLLSCHLHSEGRYAEELILKDPGSSRPTRRYDQVEDISETFPYMNGNAVFKHAVRRFAEVVHQALDTNEFTPFDLDLLVPHQANLRISHVIRKELDLPEENLYSNIQRYGNTTAASIPIALSEAWQEGKLRENDLVCLAAFGSGFTWASALLRW